jgi:hypothetical protein
LNYKKCILESSVIIYTIRRETVFNADVSVKQLILGVIMNQVKEEAKKLLDKLPDEISWDDIMYEMYVRNKIDRGLKAADEGKLVSHEDVKKRFSKK